MTRGWLNDWESFPIKDELLIEPIDGCSTIFCCQSQVKNLQTSSVADLLASICFSTYKMFLDGVKGRQLSIKVITLSLVLSSRIHGFSILAFESFLKHDPFGVPVGLWCQVSTVCVLLVRCVKPSLVSTGDEADGTENSIVVSLCGGYD